MLSSLFFLLFGSLGLYFGSEFLIDGAKNLAKKLNVSDLVIGLTIVSIGTSFPELVVGLISAFQGYTEFVIGNVLGSNIANIGLAIGLPALFFKIDFDFVQAVFTSSIGAYGKNWTNFWDKKANTLPEFEAMAELGGSCTNERSFTIVPVKS